MFTSRAFRIYQTLDEEQKRFVKEKKIQKSYKPKRWLEFFEKIADMDRESDLYRKKNIKFMLISGILTFFAFIFSDGLSVFPVSLFFFLFLGILLILIRSHYSHKNIDIENNFRLTIVPLLTIFKEDMNLDEKLFLSIDCSNMLAKEKIIRVIEPSSSTMPYYTLTYFQNPWFSMETTFRDGTILSLQIEDTIRKKDITKRTSRGKTKVKSKYKVVHKIKVQMKFPKNIYIFSKSSENIQEIGDHFEYTGMEKTVTDSVEKQIDLNSPLLEISRGYRNFKRREAA